MAFTQAEKNMLMKWKAEGMDKETALNLIAKGRIQEQEKERIKSPLGIGEQIGMQVPTGEIETQPPEEVEEITTRPADESAFQRLERVAPQIREEVTTVRGREGERKGLLDVIGGALKSFTESVLAAPPAGEVITEERRRELEEKEITGEIIPEEREELVTVPGAFREKEAAARSATALTFGRLFPGATALFEVIGQTEAAPVIEKPIEAFQNLKFLIAPILEMKPEDDDNTRTLKTLANTVVDMFALERLGKTAEGVIRSPKIRSQVAKATQKAVESVGEGIVTPTAKAVVGAVQKGVEAVTPAAKAVARAVAPVTKIAKNVTIGTVKLPFTVLKKTGKALSSATKFTISQLTGLSPETISTIKRLPNIFKETQEGTLTLRSMGDKFKTAMDKRLENLSATGKEYQGIRQSGEVVKVPVGTTESALGKFGIELENGMIKITKESVPMNRADINALQQFVNRFGLESELSGNAFLNARKELSNMSKFEQGKTSASQKLAKELRKTYDNLGKNQLTGLRELDVRFAPETKLLQQIQKDFFNADGTLKDNALSKMSNLTGKGKDFILERMEKIVPGIKNEIKALKAIEDVRLAGGQKVGTYIRGATTGFVVTGGNAFGALTALILGSPSVAVPIIQSYGRIINASKTFVNNIVSKITKGERLNTKEADFVSTAIKEEAKRAEPTFRELPTGERPLELPPTGERLLESPTGERPLELPAGERPLELPKETTPGEG